MPHERMRAPLAPSGPPGATTGTTMSAGVYGSPAPDTFASHTARPTRRDGTPLGLTVAGAAMLGVEVLSLIHI